MAGALKNAKVICWADDLVRLRKTGIPYEPS